LTPATPAASVLLAHGPDSPEVYLVRRAARLRFFGGFWAFPGGRCDPGDGDLPLIGISSQDAAQLASRRVAAVRELFEETGILLARRADGSFSLGGPELQRLRRELEAGRLAFADVLRHLQVTLHAADLRPIGNLITPPFTDVRFDTSFFVAHLPPAQEPEVWSGELDEGRWASAADMLQLWTRGELLLSPPTVMILEALRGRPVDEAPAQLVPRMRALAADKLHPISFAPRVLLIPLHTASLPPSAYTNAYLVGHDPAYLLDPGSADPAEQARLFDFLDEQIQAGLRLAAVVLTHQHPDHVGAAAVCAERYGVPILGHPRTAEVLQGKVTVTGLLQDGGRLDLGRCPGGGRWHLEALHTPGHAAGHLAFYESHYRLLFAGDLISTLSSIIIAPPEGDLALYLESLRRLSAYPCRLLLPGHGGVSSRPAQMLAEALAHRAKREAQLLAALGTAPRTIAELAPELYKGTPTALMRLAQLQMLAGLRKLEREGKVEADGDGLTAGWRLRRDN
jgi:ribonuclease/clavin/mitogillin